MAINLLRNPKDWGQTEFLIAFAIIGALWYAYEQGYFSKGKRENIDENEVPQLSTKQFEFAPDGSSVAVGATQQTGRKLSDAAINNRISALVEAYNGEAAMVSGQEAAYQALRNLNELGDADLIAAGNLYNQRYENSEYKGLGAFVNSEYLWWGTTTSRVRSALLIRLNKLSIA